MFTVFGRFRCCVFTCCQLRIRTVGSPTSFIFELDVTADHATWSRRLKDVAETYTKLKLSTNSPITSFSFSFLGRLRFWQPELFWWKISFFQSLSLSLSVSVSFWILFKKQKRELLFHFVALLHEWITWHIRILVWRYYEPIKCFYGIESA